MNVAGRKPTVPLGEVLNFRNDIVHPRDMPRGRVTFVGLEHIEPHTGMRIGAEEIELSEMTGRRARFQKGDIVYGYLRPYLNKVWIAEFDGLCSVDQHVFSVRKGIDLNYVAHFLRSAEFLRIAPVNTAPGQLPRIRSGEISRTPIPLPSFSEQLRIATILDKADALRRKRKRAIELLDSLTQSIFLEMFGDLLNGRQYPRGTIRSWVADFATGKNLAPDPDDKSDGYRVLKVSAVTSGRFVPSESKPLPLTYTPPLDHLVRRGDMLFSRANTAELIGATAIVDQDYNRLVLPDKIWRFIWSSTNPPNPNFVHALFSSTGFRQEVSKRATGTSGSMKNISKEKVLQIPLALPSRVDQDRFVDINRRIADGASASIAQNALLEAQFSSLQAHAFSDQL
ncbi:restriction endonuclease subunit S [Mesorhizobium sp. LjNodule214]|uniref:restriction endonuclease subunit S n=1 Tax=Mesorhizobium sp. LjNodule214 TaxID=3342252 RepID=UPI003ED130BE